MNDHCQTEENDKNSPGSGSTAEVVQIHGADKTSSENVSNIVEESVQRLGASVEVSAIDGVRLIGDEPVG